MFFIRLTCDITSSVDDGDDEEEDAQTPKWNEGVIKGAAFVIPDVNLECQLPLPVGKDTSTKACVDFFRNLSSTRRPLLI